MRMIDVKKLPIEQRIIWWFLHGDVGESSKTIVWALSGVPTHEHFIPYRPYTPTDFSSCYSLLLLIPEWKSEMHNLKLISKTWAVFIAHWDEMEKLYEDAIKQHDFHMWKLHKRIIELEEEAWKK